jgi:hypothetical protein
VNSCIDTLPWQQAICREVRDLVRAADPEIAEPSSSGIARTSSSRATSALLAAKDHVIVFLYDGAIVTDPEHIITGGHDNTTARTVAIRQGERLKAPALLAMFKQIVANNRAGGWRKLKTG